MSGVFEHSIKVPRLYKTVAKIVQTVREDGASLKQLVYLKKHPNIKALYALALTCLQHSAQLDQIIRRTKILVNETRLDPWLARILITELLWGKKQLSSECKPVKTVLSYEKLLNEELNNIGDVDLHGNKKAKVEKPRYVRVNTLTMSVVEAVASFEEEGWRPLYRSKNYAEFIESVSNLSGRAFIQDIHIPELLIFPPKTQFYNHPGYTSGTIILQDKASCLPAYLLNAKPGSTVLDMCASPGMKTTHLAAMLENKGKIYAVEIDKRRYDTLCEIVQSTNSYCVETINADVMTLDDKKCPGVEYILVDPSCSGSGMLDRLEVEYSSTEKCAPGRLRNLQSFQIIILRHALLNFPTAKRIVYSTCSIYAEENEQVVDDVLLQVGDAYRLVSAKNLMKNNWFNYSSEDFACKDNCLYARPETDLSNGFFVAVFERNFNVPLPEIKRKKKGEKKIEEFKNGNDNNLGEVKSEEFDEKTGEKKNQKKKKRKVLERENDAGEEKYMKDENIEVENIEEEASRKDNYSSNNNNSVEVILTKRKKSKRKYDENNDAVIETVSEDRNQKIYNDVVDDDGILVSSKKKKKCKKSRAEYENPDSIKITKDKEGDNNKNGEGEELVSRRKKKAKKKSRKDNENLEGNNQGIQEIVDNEITMENVEEVIPKKRKRKNKV